MATKRYYIVMYNKQTGVTRYKQYKCIDGFSRQKDVCWQFTKQGALQIIERLKYEYRRNIENLDFFLEEAKSDGG